MKTKKIIICFALSLCLLSTAVIVGCNNKSEQSVSITSIEKTMTTGLTDTYTILFSDGTTYNFEITNGRDAKNLDIEDLYAAYKSRYPDSDFEDFLNTVITADTHRDLTISNLALSSSLKVYSEFIEKYYSYGIGYYPQIIEETAIYCGSAVIYAINDDYVYMITNYHVLYDTNATNDSKLAEKIICYLYGSESAPVKTGKTDSKGHSVYDYGDYAITCEFVGGAVTADIAVIRAKTSDVKAVNKNVTAVTFADGYQVGEAAIAIGNSEDEGISVTKGVVSVDNEYINYSVDGTQRSYRSMRIDTAIYGGNSGGGLFDSDGKLIGITNAGDGEDQNINYAIPVSIVKAVVENILFYGGKDVKVLRLGITVGSQNSKYVFDEDLGYGVIKEDIVCTEVTKNSLAEGLGLQSGDKLIALKINDVTHNLDRYFNISDLLYTVRQGDVVSFDYYRDGTLTNSTEYTVTSSDLVSVK